jgi:long-chain acyl-CoA synthetase
MGESGLKRKLFDWALKVGEEVFMQRYDPETGTYNMGHDFDITGTCPSALRLNIR